MSFSAITAFLHQFEELPERDLLTIVLAGGCNLKCSWCAVNARQERLDRATIFSAENYRTLISGLAAENLISGVAIVGDEPLLDAAWPVAKEILDSAAQHQLKCALVTNGTQLSERSRELAAREGHVLVSLDGTGTYHDNTRGVKGTYDLLMRGMKAAARLPNLLERITVASVVQPERYIYLNDIPGVLSSLGIKRWALSPLIQFRRIKPARLHPRLFPTIYRELPRLIERGRAAGIDVFVDDGLSLLLQADRNGEFDDIPFERPAVPDLRVLRMRPDGLTVRYENLLDTDTSRGLQWDGVEAPATFYHRLYDASTDCMAQAGI